MIEHFPTFLANNQVWFWSQKVPQMLNPPPKNPKKIIPKTILQYRALFFALLADNQLWFWSQKCHKCSRSPESRFFSQNAANIIENFFDFFDWYSILNPTHLIIGQISQKVQYQAFSRLFFRKSIVIWIPKYATFTQDPPPHRKLIFYLKTLLADNQLWFPPPHQACL